MILNNPILKVFCVTCCVCLISNKNTVQCMEAPLPATPKDYEDNLQKSLNNEEKNNNNINEGNNNPINCDKNKVANLRESLNEEIDSLRKTCPDFLTKVKATYDTIGAIATMCYNVLPTINYIKNNIVTNMENTIQNTVEKIGQKCSTEEEFQKVCNEYNAKIPEVTRKLQSIEIMPQACADSFGKVANNIVHLLALTVIDIKSSYENLIKKSWDWYDKQTKQTNIPLSVDENELKDIKKKILEIKSNMNDFSYRINDLIITHYYNNTNKIINEIRKIAQFNSEYKEIVQIDMTNIGPHLIDIVNYIHHQLHCFDFHYTAS